tara:strand:+ start:28335 stop:28751 length:417 start_codon:yes stop_codon:yes gene_type:complete
LQPKLSDKFRIIKNITKLYDMIEVQELDNISVVKIVSKLYSVDKLILTITKLLESGTNTIVSFNSEINIETSLLQRLFTMNVLAIKNKCSFLIANFTSTQLNIIENSEYSEKFTFTPTLSEAQDIVYMEEIERELDLK